MPANSSENHNECPECGSGLLCRTNSPQESSPVKRPPRWTSIILDTWLSEGLAIGFSLACFIAIYAVLRAYDNQKRPNIAYGLSLNAIVSVLATSCKSSLIFAVSEAISQLKWLRFQGVKPRQLLEIQDFDSASRGPLGSILILFRHRGQSLASLGAVITVLLLAFDPFIQQVLSYPTRQIAADNGNAAAQQMRYFYPFAGWDTAYYRGIWADDDAGQPTREFVVQPTCESRNCTWPPFQSVGVCSRCADLTTTATLDCDSPKLNGTPRSLNGACRVVLPQGNASNTTVEVSARDGEFREIQFPYTIGWLVDSYEPYNGSNLTYEGIKNPLMVVAYAQLRIDEESVQSSADPRHALVVDVATECSLSLCLKTYDIAVVNGNASINTSIVDHGQTFSRYGDVCWMPGNGPTDITMERVPLGDGLVVHANETEFAFCGLQQFPSEPLTGLSTARWAKINGSSWDGPVLQSVSNDNLGQISVVGLERVMSNLALSLTKLGMESRGITSLDHSVNGTIYTTEVIVNVHWTWMILPTSLVFLGCTFLISSIIANKKKRMSLWKSSILPLLYHGLDEVEVKDDPCTNCSLMEKMAEGTDVYLQYSNRAGRVMLQKERSN